MVFCVAAIYDVTMVFCVAAVYDVTMVFCVAAICVVRKTTFDSSLFENSNCRMT